MRFYVRNSVKTQFLFMHTLLFIIKLILLYYNSFNTVRYNHCDTDLWDYTGHDYINLPVR